MKTNKLFESCLAKVPNDIKFEIDLNVDIANRIDDILKERHISQREFAKMMGKKESEVSRWLSGTHGFTTATIAKISAALDTPIVEVKGKRELNYVFFPATQYASFNERANNRQMNRNTTYTSNYIS